MTSNATPLRRVRDQMEWMLVSGLVRHSGSSLVNIPLARAAAAFALALANCIFSIMWWDTDDGEPATHPRIECAFRELTSAAAWFVVQVVAVFSDVQIQRLVLNEVLSGTDYLLPGIAPLVATHGGASIAAADTTWWQLLLFVCEQIRADMQSRGFLARVAVQARRSLEAAAQLVRWSISTTPSGTFSAPVLACLAGALRRTQRQAELSLDLNSATGEWELRFNFQPSSSAPASVAMVATVTPEDAQFLGGCEGSLSCLARVFGHVTRRPIDFISGGLSAVDVAFRVAPAASRYAGRTRQLFMYVIGRGSPAPDPMAAVANPATTDDVISPGLFPVVIDLDSPLSVTSWSSGGDCSDEHLSDSTVVSPPAAVEAMAAAATTNSFVHTRVFHVLIFPLVQRLLVDWADTLYYALRLASDFSADPAAVLSSVAFVFHDGALIGPGSPSAFMARVTMTWTCPTASGALPYEGKLWWQLGEKRFSSFANSDFAVVQVLGEVEPRDAATLRAEFFGVRRER